MVELWPYATTSSLVFWKERIFDFRDIQMGFGGEALPGIKAYEPFRAIDHFLPEHLMDDGPKRFYDDVMKQKDVRIASLLALCDVPEISGPKAAYSLDQLGDQLAAAIEPNKKVLKKVNGRYELRNRSWSSSFLMAPIWNSISIDLGLLIGDLVIETYPKQHGRWACPKGRDNPMGAWDYPRLQFDMPAREENDQEATLLEKLAKTYDRNKSKDFTSGGWLDAFDNALQELGLNPDEYDSGEYSPDVVRYARHSNSNIDVHPMATSEQFLTRQFLKRFLPDEMDSYQRDTFMSLGDAIRPDTFPNWTGLNVANT